MSDLRVHEWCACIHFAFAASIAFLEQECNNSVHTHLNEFIWHAALLIG
jgi:hypothetical protein